MHTPTNTHAPTFVVCQLTFGPMHTGLCTHAGATVVGKTHMSEMAYSLDGINAHYGTPRNAAAPGRNTGGSSSGSAVSHTSTCWQQQHQQ
jgi:hypothetical protein